MRENDYWSVSGKENPLNFSALFFFRMSFMLKYTTLYTLRVCLDVFPFFSVAIFSKTFYIYIFCLFAVALGSVVFRWG